MSFTDELRDYALSIGCDRLRVTSADSIAGVADLTLQHVSSGLLGELPWFSSGRAAASSEPTRLLKTARAVICIAVSYLSEDAARETSGNKTPDLCGEVARSARGADYHRVVRDRLRLIAAWLLRRGGDGATVRHCVDKAWLAERAFARRAGLGTLGRNSTLITPRHGSWVFLGELLTGIPIKPDPVIDELDRFSNCGDCSLCMTACPTGALLEPGTIDSRACLAALTIENSGWLPRHYRALLGSRVYGCDVCQSVCPRNRMARPGDHPEFSTENGVGRWIPLADLVVPPARGAAMAERLAGTPLARAAMRGLRRNAVVALGNQPDRSAVPLLMTALADADPVIRGHSAWALGRLGGANGRSALSKARAIESDPDARSEIQWALDSG